MFNIPHVFFLIETLRTYWYCFSLLENQQGLMKTLQWEKALDLFRSMRYHNVKPDLITFNSLLAGLTKARQPAL